MENFPSLVLVVFVLGCSTLRGTQTVPQIINAESSVVTNTDEFVIANESYALLIRNVGLQAGLGISADNAAPISLTVGPLTQFSAVALEFLTIGATGSFGSPDGGTGGGAGGIQAGNSSSVTLASSVVLSGQNTGIAVNSSGGPGGSGNSPSAEPGSGRFGGLISLDHSGLVTVGTVGAPLAIANGSAISGVSLSSTGGGMGTVGNVPPIQNLGSGGNVSLVQSGTVTVAGSAATNGATVFGVAAMSTGAAGANNPGTNSPGAGINGAGAGAVSLTFDPGALVRAVNGGGNVDGAGIFANVVGGAAGSNTSSSGAGGTGGVAGSSSTPSVQGVLFGARVETEGPQMIGISSLVQGGQGGAGNGGSASGAGGLAGGVEWTLQDNGSTAAAVTTTGEGSHGILGQSIGGIGGSSGVNGFGTSGGHGGAGGASGSMDVSFNGGSTVTTSGTASVGVAIATIGGLGGRGGDITAGFVTSGGTGGSGATSGEINFVASGSSSVTTSGAGSHAVFLLSEGGFGGEGGKGGTAIGSTGGNGGTGGGSGLVDASTSEHAWIATSGSNAIGIVARSVSGLGGAGGSSGVSGGGGGGSGGAGGASGGVVINHDGLVSTTGPSSTGILAQSLTGGGGSGGSTPFSVFSLGNNSGSTSGAVGAINMAITGTVTTSGAGSHGVQSQSISGGGGAAGSTTGVLTFGASAGPASAGGLVSPTFTGASVMTSGTGAIGVLSQSIGGGGGSANSASGIITVGGSGGGGGAGGTVVLSQSTSTFATQGNNAYAAVAQSVGGGGGLMGSTDAGSSPTSEGLLVLGASGGSGGNGGTVTFGLNASSLTTEGISSHALIGQSIAGGGGVGGDAKATNATFLATDIPVVSAGGKAGNGGKGGLVTIAAQQSDIATGQSNAIGVVAQSIGGGGGTGGTAFTTAKGIGWSMGMALGGGGGTGGDGGLVTVTLSDSTVNTATSTASWTPIAGPLPVDAHGVVAQSIGGGGGQGGTATANGKSLGLIIPIPDSDNVVEISSGVSLTLGGFGGAAGDGGSVVADFEQGSTMVTRGDGSHGIVAQSVGGGGGNGGDSTSMNSLRTLLGDNPDITSFTIGADMSVGGFAGATGQGGTVAVTIGETSSPVGTSKLTTTGDYANGVLAQSIGGGGGAGGVGTATTDGLGTNPTIAINAHLVVGGRGSGGGNGGEVTVTVAANGAVTTFGSSAMGVLAQSVGGGGGTSQGGTVDIGAGGNKDVNDVTVSGSATVTVNTGGNGKIGGDGEAVTTMIAGSVSTGGDGAVGVKMQSIGGGGGVGGSVGDAVSPNNPVADVVNGVRQFAVGVYNDEVTAALNGNVSFGGKGGAGGNGGAVTSNFTGQVQTAGDYAHGVQAQSVGGGGGTGGTAFATNQTAAPTITLNGGLADGGNGGSGGDGGGVILNLTGGSISTGEVQAGRTTGVSAYGVWAQSVGGGGGDGADGSVNANGTITLGADWSGNGGKGVNGGQVSVSQADAATTTRISTVGAAAHGMVLQSVGGGGGGAGSGSSLFGALGPFGGSLSLTAGGQSAASGSGGLVELNGTSTMATNVQTSGANAIGILGQSIGGGGGLITSINGSSGGSVNLGGRATGNSAGGNVSLNLGNGSVVTTDGAGAHGVVAQSIGGGGGLVINGVATGPSALSVTPGSFVNTHSTTGNGGAAAVTSFGNITTTGGSAHGIIAQSVGGGGGITSNGANEMMFAGSTGNASSTGAGGLVSVQQFSGTISAQGENSVGVFAQSIGTSGGSTITVDLYGNVEGGSGPQGAGVWVHSVNNASQINVHAGGQLSALSGTAIYTTVGTLVTANNAGTITGDVILQTSNLFHNQTSGTFLSGDLVEATINDDGVTLVGNALAGGIAKLSVTGDYTQTTSATIDFGIDGITAFDEVLVNGLADFDGYTNLWFGNNYLPELNAEFGLITGAAGSEFNFQYVQLNNVPTAYMFEEFTQFNNLENTITWGIRITAVPEPTAACLVLFGLAALCGNRRRRTEDFQS